MKYNKLGANAGIEVSSLCLGAMTFGEADANSFMHKVSCDDSTSHAIMDRALELGINFIDTADIYGQDGLSERVMGAWFEKSKKREQIVLATKVRFRMFEGANGAGASRHRIVHGVEQSLKRLKTDRIDLYQIHMQDNATPEEETLRALDDLVHQGKVLYIGASNYAAYRLVESLGHSKANGLAGYSTIQMQYNLLSRDIEREHVPTCKRWGLGILPWSPLAAGFLTGKYQRGCDQDGRLSATDRWKGRYASLDNDKNWGVLDIVRSVANEVDASPAAVSLAWLTQQSCVTSVIFGARTVEQLEANARAGDITLSDDQLKRLEEASRPEWGYPYDFIKMANGSW